MGSTQQIRSLVPAHQMWGNSLEWWPRKISPRESVGTPPQGNTRFSPQQGKPVWAELKSLWSGESFSSSSSSCCSQKGPLGMEEWAQKCFTLLVPQPPRGLAAALPPIQPSNESQCPYLFCWSVVDLQCCVNVCCAAKWFHYIYFSILFSIFHIFQFFIFSWFVTRYWI